MLMDKEVVKSLLPHREPFLFIDTVESVSHPHAKNGERLENFKDIVGAEVVSHYRTCPDHPIFAGHFPGNPILPGVVQVEMMAQGSIFVMYLIEPQVAKIDIEVALLSVQNSKFRKPVLPGMDLTIRTKCTHVRGGFLTHDCSLYHHDELMSQTTIMASVRFEVQG